MPVSILKLGETGICINLKQGKTFAKYGDQLILISVPYFFEFANPALDMPGVRVGLRAL